MLEKYRYNVFRCTRCGMCRAKYTDKVRRVCPDREHTGGFEHDFARGRIAIARGILEGKLTYSRAFADALSTCTTCGNCTQQCGTLNLETGEPLIDIVKIIEAMRADFVDLGLAPPQHIVLASRTEENRNPYGEPKDLRNKWAEGLNIPDKAEVMFFVGCTESYRRKEVADATAKVLRKLKVNFGISNDEWCCGSPLFRTGSRKLGEELAKHNVEVFKKADKIITACAGCYRTLKEDYPEIVGDLPFEVLHITEFLNAIREKGGLDLKEKVMKKVTYHDPCHLGRHMGVYDPPRSLLRAIPGIEFEEMFPTRENAWCCGGGGGVRMSNPDLAAEIATDRIVHAKEVGAEAIVSACPFCKTNILDAVKKAESDLEVYDLMELIARSTKV